TTPYLPRAAYDHPRHLHSFPTRRSSDLVRASVDDELRRVQTATERTRIALLSLCRCARRERIAPTEVVPVIDMERERDHGPFARSEEHTSELQSQSNLVCRLLLEKKNTI